MDSEAPGGRSHFEALKSEGATILLKGVDSTHGARPRLTEIDKTVGRRSTLRLDRRALAESTQAGDSDARVSE